MSIEVISSAFRTHFSTYLAHHAETGDRIVLTKYGRKIGAFVSIRDLQKLEADESLDEAFVRERQAERMREFSRERERRG